MDKKGWVQLHYSNDTAVRKCCRDKVYSIYKRLLKSWNMYNKQEAILCVRELYKVAVPPNATTTWTWNQKAVPSKNKV